MGSFSSLEKANSIVEQLVGDSYKAYHRKLSEDLYRVLIGPYTDAEEAVQHQRDVDQSLSLSTLLMKFEA